MRSTLGSEFTKLRGVKAEGFKAEVKGVGFRVQSVRLRT